MDTYLHMYFRRKDAGMEPEFILTRSTVEALGATELEGQLLMLVRMLELCMLETIALTMGPIAYVAPELEQLVSPTSLFIYSLKGKNDIYYL